MHQQYFNETLKTRILDPVFCQTCGFVGGGYDAVQHAAAFRVAAKLKIPSAKYKGAKGGRYAPVVRKEVGRLFYLGKLTRQQVAAAIRAIKPGMEMWAKKRMAGDKLTYKRKTIIAKASRSSSHQRVRWSDAESHSLCTAIRKLGCSGTNCWKAVALQPGLGRRTGMQCRDRIRNVMKQTGTATYEAAAEVFLADYEP